MDISLSRQIPACLRVQKIWLACVLAVGGMVGWLAADLTAKEPAAATVELNELLDAGEFAPALEMARNATDPVQRDEWLGQIASSQARAGARGASFQSASYINDDRLRSSSFHDAGSQPLGGSGAQGGGVVPDFESLIELIQETITDDPGWADDGGAGTIKEFPGGVYVDASGVLQRVTEDQTDGLAGVRQTATRIGENRQARRTSGLRKVSLNRLEKEVQMRLAAGRPLDQEMLVLAGLKRVQYVFLYPETGDVVLAGPAGDWAFDREGRVVSAEGGQPVLRLDDLVVLLRQTQGSAAEPFGCSIDPTEKGLADVQTFLAESNSSQKPLKPGQVKNWLNQVRDHLGQQTASVFGVDPRSRVAQVLLEADYRMKLVGIGLEDGTVDVPSFLQLVRVPAGEKPPALSVLRWWFTLNYDALLTGRDRDVFELRGQGVKVMSQNELLTQQGERVQTDKTEEVNVEFARNFTQHFEALATKYPIYAELRNIFDLALVASLLKSENLAEKVNWHMTCFSDPEQFVVARGPAPKAVQSVVNHRVIHKKNILAAVSGGVQVDTSKLVAPEAIQVDNTGSLGSMREGAIPERLPRGRWWWD